MGIRFLDSILALITAAAIVFAAYLVGHALSSDHAGWAWITAAGLLAAAAALGFLTTRRIRSYAEQRGENLHH
jgi:hypothetical protein